MKKFLLFFIVLLLSCTKSGPTEYGSAGMDPVFKRGDQITYRWSLSFVDSVGTTTSSQTDTVDATIGSVNDTIGALDSLIRIDVFSRKYSGEGSTWYQLIGNDFVDIAYRYGGIGPPLVQPIVLTRGGSNAPVNARFSMTTPAILRAFLRESSAADSIYVRSDPRIVYRYPLVAGLQWVSFTQPFLEVREVMAESTIVVNGNPEQCAVVQTTLPQVLPSVQWLDFVNRGGLRKRSLVFPNLTVTTEDNPEGTGKTATAYETLEIISTSTLNP